MSDIVRVNASVKGTVVATGVARESALRAIVIGTVTGVVTQIVSETIAIVEITLLRSTLVMIAILTTEIVSMVETVDINLNIFRAQNGTIQNGNIISKCSWARFTH